MFFAIVFLAAGEDSVLAQNPGTVDTSFNTGSGPNGAVLSVASQSDGKTIIGGAFTSVNGTALNGVARLNTDGSVDTAFNPGAGANGPVDFVTVLPSGTILAAGSFSTFNGSQRLRIVRLTTSGSVDTGFSPSLASTGTIGDTSVAVQSDGKIVLLGGVTAGGNYLLTRLNTNGSLDNTFSLGMGANGLINALAVQSDGKILVGGSFSSINSVARSAIARLNSNGSVDTTFNPGTGADGAVQAVAIQSDGKIVIAGVFSEVNGSSHYGVARLGTDGTVDSGFGTSSYYDDIESIDAIAIQPNGSIIVGGNFSGIDDYYSPNLARLFTDGSFDYNFDELYYGPSDTVDALSIAPSGQLLIGGLFTNVNGSSLNFIARLNDDPHPAFFEGETSLGNGVYYLRFSSGYGNNFGEYSYLTDPNYIYSYDLGYEYLFDANDGDDGIYLYDFAANTFFYTSPYFPYPYLYDFSLNSVLYYYQGTTNPRYFFDFRTGQILTK